ncbi:MAG TPA: DUF3231 family protein [Symbiobacteriaceae bacterium]|nr:DUF3231 family protein [Symbiobacteriaceae bacterium]
MNLLESLFHAVREPKSALHAGEAFSLWTYDVALQEVHALGQLMLNHTADRELTDFIENLITDLGQAQEAELHKLMRNEGIEFPALTAQKPLANSTDLPAGARFTETEIANLLVVKVQGLLILAHGALLQSIRNDMGAMWYRYHSGLLVHSFKLKQLMERRGWLRHPPLFRPSPAPH